MSFRSSPHPLSYEGKQVKHPISHRHHYNISELHKTYKITDNPTSELLGGTFLNDRKLRSLDENKFGSINGSSLKSGIPQPDIVDKPLHLPDLGLHNHHSMGHQPRIEYKIQYFHLEKHQQLKSEQIFSHY